VDVLVIPGAFLMGMGRIGNFIDGQIVGRVTDVCWAVQFPDADGFRHPVVLYDGVKNLLLIPFLLWIRRRKPPVGMLTAHFIFWYGFLRIFVDVFREYPTTLLGVATGQAFNLFMSALGACLFVAFRRRARTAEAAFPSPLARPSPAWLLWSKRFGFALVLAFSLTLPSDWTQDIPARYGKRHPGLRYSIIYPRIE
jgi:phosphatidylglycerol:prolipoprotein diacylglycerol transferase